jgi:starch phosphorylase
VGPPAFNGSYFNTNRMVKQYIRNAYYPVTLIEQAKVQEAAFAD